MQFELQFVPRILPELLLLVLALLVVGSDIFERWGENEAAQSERARSAGSLAAIGLGLIFAITLVQSGFLFRLTPETFSQNPLLNSVITVVRNLQSGGPVQLTGEPWAPMLGAVATDYLTMVGRLLVIGAAFLTAMLVYGSARINNPAEFYALLLISTIGMCLMASSTELITAYLAVELTSIPLYVLAGYFRGNSNSPEAGMKYFVYGALSSGILLYGMSLAYGYTVGAGNVTEPGAATQFAQIVRAAGTAGASSSLLLLALIFIIAGIGYKVSVVPFHSWAPDVYQGAPTTITAFISTASKAAGFILLLRVLTEAFPGLAGQVTLGSTGGGWASLLALLALLTLLFGNLAALPQTNAKRLLGYSSIAQAGFLLLGLVALSATAPADRALGTSSLLYYLLVYTVTNLGAFGALAVVGEATGGDDFQHLNGLWRRNLPLTLLLTLCILSLAGIPPLAGFLAKFYVFMAAWQAGAQWLVVVAVAMTIVSLYYYLRFLKAMFIAAPETEQPIATPGAMNATLIISAVLVLALGIFPSVVLRVIDQVQLVAGR